MVSKVQVSQCVTYYPSKSQLLQKQQRRENRIAFVGAILLIPVIAGLFALWCVKSTDAVDMQSQQAHAYLAQIEAQKLHDSVVK